MSKKLLDESALVVSDPMDQKDLSREQKKGETPVRIRRFRVVKQAKARECWRLLR